MPTETTKLISETKKLLCSTPKTTQLITSLKKILGDTREPGTAYTEDYVNYANKM